MIPRGGTIDPLLQKYAVPPSHWAQCPSLIGPSRTSALHGLWPLGHGPWAMQRRSLRNRELSTFPKPRPPPSPPTPRSPSKPRPHSTRRRRQRVHLNTPAQPQLPPPERGSAASIARAPLPAPLLPPTWPPRHHRPPQPTMAMRAPAPSPMEALPPRAPIPHRSPGLHGQSQRPRRRYRTAIRTASTRSWSSAS